MLLTCGEEEPTMQNCCPPCWEAADHLFLCVCPSCSGDKEAEGVLSEVGHGGARRHQRRSLQHEDSPGPAERYAPKPPPPSSLFLKEPRQRAAENSHFEAPHHRRCSGDEVGGGPIRARPRLADANVHPEGRHAGRSNRSPPPL